MVTIHGLRAAQVTFGAIFQVLLRKICPSHLNHVLTEWADSVTGKPKAELLPCSAKNVTVFMVHGTEMCYTDKDWIFKGKAARADWWMADCAARWKISKNQETRGIRIMEETMKDYERELEASFRTIQEGDVIKGTVIGVNEEEVTLDLKYYTQGIIKAADMSDDPGFSVMADVHEGDVIEASVVKMDDGQGNILLSKREANAVIAWDVLTGYMEEKKDLTVKVSEVVNAGVVAYLEGIRGFIPASQLDISYVENLEEYQGKVLEVRVITVDEEKKKLVLSAKEILREKAKEEHDHKVAMIVPGTVLEGTVESLQTYGAFVDLKDGLSGLVHISQISQRRIKKPSEVLKVGDKVKVKVLNTNNGKISLSMKAVEEQQAEEMENVDVKQYGSSESLGTSLGELFAKLNLK